MLDNGELCEYGEPHDLFRNDDSILLKLVDKTGLAESQRLKNIAHYIGLDVTPRQTSDTYTMQSYCMRHAPCSHNNVQCNLDYPSL